MRLDTYYLNMAETASERSKCVSLKVGCVIVKDDKIISTGLNGTLRGAINCDEHFPGGNGPAHHGWSIENEIHAEMNAIIQAGRCLKGAVAYTLISPCRNCLKHLLAAGVKTIYFRTKYYRMTDEQLQEMVDYCEENGASLYKEGQGDYIY